MRIYVAGNDDSSPSGIWVGTRQDSAHTLLVDPHTMAITVGGTPLQDRPGEPIYQQVVDFVTGAHVYQSANPLTLEYEAGAHAVVYPPGQWPTLEVTTP